MGARYTPLTGYAPYNCGSVFMRSEVDTTKYKYYKIDMTRESEFIGIIEVILLGKQYINIKKQLNYWNVKILLYI